MDLECDYHTIRSRTAPCPLRCRDRHTNALRPATQQQNHELFPPRGKSLPLPLSPTHTTRLRGAKQNPRGERHTKKANLLQRSRHPNASAFHYRTRLHLAHSLGASCAHLYLRSLSSFDSRATHARTLLPAALASVPFGFVLVRVRVGGLSIPLRSYSIQN